MASEGLVTNNRDDDFVCPLLKTTVGMIKNMHETLIDEDNTRELRKVKRKLVQAYESGKVKRKVKRKLLIEQAKEDLPPKIRKNEEIEIKGKKKISEKSGVDEESEKRRSKTVGKRMKDKYKIVKKEDGIAKIRNSPKVLSEIISSLSYEQQTWVKDVGFGSLLHFDLGELPQRLAFKVLEAFDKDSCMLKLQNGNIKITEREVYNVLGLPYEGDEVVIAQDDVRHERIIQWRAQFPINNDQSLIKASEVVDRMKHGRIVDELFKMNFLIIITNVLIRSNTNNYLSQMILSFDDELDNCAQYNWAQYLIKNLVITKEIWMRTTSLFYTGSMIFLIMLYVDRVLYKEQQVVRRDNPSFRGWTKGRLRERESIESEPGAFGSGAILEAASRERIPENQRITENKGKNDKERKRGEEKPNGKPHEDWLERLHVKASLLIDTKSQYDSELANAKNMHPNDKNIIEIESKINDMFRIINHDKQKMGNECHEERGFIFKAAMEEYQDGGDAKMGAVEKIALVPVDWLNSWERILETQKDLEDLRAPSLSLRMNLKNATTQVCKNVIEEHGQVNYDKNKEENGNITRRPKELKRSEMREVKVGQAYRFSKYTKLIYDVWRWCIQSQKDQLIEPVSCKRTEFVDFFSESSKESGCVGSLPGFNLESDFSPPLQKLYARHKSKDYRGKFSVISDATSIESDFQKGADVSQEVSHVITRTLQSPSLNDSLGSCSQALRSVSAEMVGFFRQLEEQIQENKFDLYRVLPPQIQLDEEIIQEYEKVLKKYLSGRLFDLANDSNFQDFNKVLHYLLACRRIPSHLQQGFLTLRWELPTLSSRAYELQKEVNRGMVMPLARSKEREELKSILGKYRQVEDNLVELEEEKEANLLVIDRLQTRNECLTEEVRNIRADAVMKNVVGGCGKLCNDKMGKLLEQMKDRNSEEIVRLKASNEAIDSNIIKFAEEAKVLHEDATAQNYKVINLEAMGAVYEANVENAMNQLVTMELKWKECVKSLDY